MEKTKLGAVESRFADLIWASAPVSTTALIALAKDALEWKRTTTYTVLKRLCERGLFDLTEGTVTALISREEFYARQSREYVEEAFDGSLPAFVAAFAKRQDLSEQELDEVQRMIDRIRKGGN